MQESPHAGVGAGVGLGVGMMDDSDVGMEVDVGWQGWQVPSVFVGQSGLGLATHCVAKLQVYPIGQFGFTNRRCNTCPSKQILCK